MTETFFLMNLINHIQTMPQRITQKVFEALKQMVTIEHRERSWYSYMMKWFNYNGLDTLLILYTLQNDEQNKVIYLNDGRNVIPNNEPHTRIQIMSPQRITQKAFEALKQMVQIELTEGSWYSQAMKGLNYNGLDTLSILYTRWTKQGIRGKIYDKSMPKRCRWNQISLFP